MSQVHRCRFLGSHDSHVTAMAFNHTSPGKDAPANSNLRLAAGRSNGSIEIWNPLQNWNLDLTLQGSKGRSIEDLVWSPDHLRIYTVGATEKITEWDLQSMQPVHHHDAFAGVVWAIQVSPNGKFLAAACETGVIVIFDLQNGFEFVKRLPSADTSLACLAWLDDDRVVAGGADGRLRVWDIPTTRIVATMKVDKSKGPDKTLVWKVISIGHNQFVSGDSNGYIKFWDAKTFTLYQSFQAHPGDVLCLAADSTGRSVFSSGLDQKIIWMRMTDVKHKRWTLMSSRTAHTAEIRCMASYESKNASLLASGGLQKEIVINSVTSFDQKRHHKLPIPFNGIATTSDLIYTWDMLTVSIWALEDGSKRRLADINIGDEEFVTACAVSKELELMVVGTRHSYKVFDIEGLSANKITNISRRQAESDDDENVLPIPASDGLFWVGFHGKKLVCINHDQEIHVVDVTTKKSHEIEYSSETVKTSHIAYANNAKLACISPNGKTLAVCRQSNYVDIFDLTKFKLKDTLPRPGESVTSMAFRDDKQLLLATVFQNVYEFDLGSMALTPWSKQFSRYLPYKLTQQRHNVAGMFSDPVDKNRVWLYGNTWLAYLDLSTTRPYRTQKRKHQDEDEDEEQEEVEISENEQGPIFWLTNKYNPILFASKFDKGLLVSEHPIETVPTMWSRQIKF